VYGDPKRLQQIVLNLLNNAIKFTPPGGRVQVTAAPAATDAIEICVSDTGIGIAPDALQKVFEPFYQSADRRPGASGGLGLGLPLVKELVEAHGGSVSVASDGPDRGTLVHVRLPAASSGAAELAG
jgi:signal transduction histidine kinase